jgi:hypothetical protein
MGGEKRKPPGRTYAAIQGAIHLVRAVADDTETFPKGGHPACPSYIQRRPTDAQKVLMGLDSRGRQLHGPHHRLRTTLLWGKGGGSHFTLRTQSVTLGEGPFALAK